jgi:hypothetical protein
VFLSQFPHIRIILYSVHVYEYKCVCVCVCVKMLKSFVLGIPREDSLREGTYGNLHSTHSQFKFNSLQSMVHVGCERSGSGRGI